MSPTEDPHATGDPQYPLRLIPRSGADPDLRDELNQRLEDRFCQLDAELERIGERLDQIEHSADYQQRMEAECLRAEHAEKLRELKRVGEDLMLGIRAAFEQTYGPLRSEPF